MATDRNDELLMTIHRVLHDGQQELLAVLGDIRDRLPVPVSIEVVGGEPGGVKLREPAASADAPAEGDSATVRIEEPAPTAPAARPVKKATPRKATRPKSTS